MNNYLLYLIESSLSLIFLFGIYYLLLRKHSNFLFNRIFLLISLASSLITPLFDFSFLNSGMLYFVNLNTIIIGENTQIANSSPSISLISIGKGIYIIISSLFLLKLAWELFSVLKIKQKAEPNDDLLHHRRVYLSQNENFSFFHWIFIRQEDAGSSTILEHERCHSKMGHSFDIILLKVLQILFWFNPILFLMERELRLQHEYAVDEAVLQGNPNISSYQQLLLNQVFNMKFSLVSNNFNQTFLKNRFTMMTKKENKKWGRFILIALLSLAFISPAIISCTTETAQNEPEEILIPEAPTKTTENTISEDETADPTEEVTFMVVEEMPLFPGGEKAMYTYIGQNLEYPEQAKKEGIQGTVFVGFIVEKDGSISDIEIVRGVSEELDQAAMEVFKNMPKWTAGKQRGKAVRVQYRLPISYKLQ